MKILALRGENLASLEHFDIPFDAPPLSESGLFSIDGPTGAGKSTLLDSLCLALFDRVPRLVGARDAADASREGLSPTDPRAVLRRGAGAGMAEVDFRGRDGERYRATWEVWRARKAPDGRLQNQRMRLVRLDAHEELTGKHRTETLGTIQERIGLDFDQFRRAVLLAQGDFSAFLRARPEERAQLLERMTGTEAFSLISVAAFARHKEDEERVSTLEARRTGNAPLEAEARAALQAEVEGESKATAELQTRREVIRSQLEARERRAELVAELEGAEGAARQAESAWIEAGELRAELAREAQLAPLRPQWEALQSLLQELARSIRERDEATEVARTASETKKRAQEEAERARAALVEQEAEAKRRAPELEAAAALDARRSEAEEEEAEAVATVARLRAELEPALDRCRALRQARADVEADLARLATSIDNDVRQMAPRWPSLARELGRWVAALTERDRTLDAIARHAEEERRQQAALEAETEKLKAGAESLASARQDLEEARRALTAHRRIGGPHRLSEAFAGLSELESERSGLLRRMEQAKQDRSTIRRLERDKDKAQAKLRKARAEARRAIRSRRQKEAELEELESRFALGRLRRELHAHRSALLEEGPCPLCGAETHGDPGPPESLPESELTRLEKLRKQIQKLETKRVDKEIEDKTATERVAELERNIRDKEERAESAQAAWLTFRRSLEMVWVDSAFLAHQRVQALALRMGETPSPKQLAEVEESLAETGARLRAHAAEDERRAAQLERCETKEAQARSSQEAAEAERRRMEEDLRAHLAAGNLLRQRADALAGAGFAERVRELCPSPLEEEAVTDPRAFLDAWAPRMERAEALLEHEVQQQSLRSQLHDQQRGASETLARAHARFEEARARRDRARARREGAAAARCELLDGRSLQEVQQALETKKQQASQVLEAAQARATQAEASEAAARSRIDALSEGVRRSEAERDTRRARLEAAAVTAGLDLEALAPALARPVAAGAQEKVTALEEARRAAWVAVEDRTQRLAAFDAKQPELPEPDALTEALADVDAQLRVRSERLLTLRTRLAQDDEAKQRWTALQAELEEAEQRRRLSAELSELIGSADGRKFRTFAQGLSLSALLSQANLHLRRLRPRYRLIRAPGRDIDIQVVDRDLGDEIRSVSTLSGGESFLVSLALALGLSSLSARDLAIESLFIDEGFGHLDKEALEVAITTLDALQAEGRTIAIVSHVPDVAERIGYGVEVRPLEPGRSRVRIRGG